MINQLDSITLIYTTNLMTNHTTVMTTAAIASNRIITPTAIPAAAPLLEAAGTIYKDMKLHEQ